MSNTINDSMPPRPDVEFDFNLPHGIDAGDSVKGNLHSTHGYQENDNLPKAMHEHVEQDIDIDMRDRSNDDNSIYDQNSSDQDMNHQILQILEQGFSGDDDAPQAFDRSWSGHQARKSPSTSKKSPRTDDGDDEASPRVKRPRQSLFGGPTDVIEEDQFDDLFGELPEEGLRDQADNLLETEVPRENIGNRLSSLDLEAQETEVHSSEQPLNLSFGFAESDRDSMSPRVSPGLSDGEIVIPPDTQVCAISS
jgi:hypothetical protein